MVVQHQTKDQNEDEWAEVKKLLNGVNEEKHSDAQKQPNAAFDLLQNVDHEVGHDHGNGQCAEQVDRDVGQHLTA